jgi:hypothetical protein
MEEKKDVVPEDAGLEAALEADVETPEIVDHGKKKKSWKSLKFGGIAVGVSLLFLGLMSIMSSGKHTAEPGVVRTSTMPSDAASFDRTGAADATTNPEANRIKQEAIKEEAAKAAKNGGSFMVADPFGADSKQKDDLDARAREANKGVVAPINQDNVPPPPPPVDKGAGEKEVSPGDKMMSSIHEALFRVAKPGVSLGPDPQFASVNAAGGNTAKVSNSPQEYAIRAGDQLYGQLTSGLNSLVPETPARAVVRSGKWKGAILMGHVTVKDNKYMVLQFTSMSFGKTTYAIQAIAVSADTGQAGLSDEVNSRFNERYALMAGMGFLQAVGASVMTQGQTSIQSIGTGGSSLQQTTPTRTGAQTALIGLGGAAQAVAPAMQEIQSSIKPEVIIYPGKDIGIIFTQPFSPTQNQAAQNAGYVPQQQQPVLQQQQSQPRPSYSGQQPQPVYQQAQPGYGQQPQPVYQQQPVRMY